VPADASSSILLALTQLTHTDPLQPSEAPDLRGYLATIHDPRSPRGRRHPLVAILAMTAAAVLTGARSLAAIAEWAADAPQPVRAALGARRDAPDFWSVPAEATIRRTLARLDPEALAAAIGAWLTDGGQFPPAVGPRPQFLGLVASAGAPPNRLVVSARSGRQTGLGDRRG
jgi:hypothetical protein